MDQDTRDKFDEQATSLNEIKTLVETDIAYRKGLDLPNRMTNAENEIDEKASWNGLYLAVGLVVGIVLVALAVAKGIKTG